MFYLSFMYDDMYDFVILILQQINVLLLRLSDRVSAADVKELNDNYIKNKTGLNSFLELSLFKSKTRSLPTFLQELLLFKHILRHKKCCYWQLLHLTFNDVSEAAWFTLSGQPGHDTRPHIRLPPSFMGTNVWMTLRLNVDLIRKLRESFMCQFH